MAKLGAGGRRELARVSKEIVYDAERASEEGVLSRELFLALMSDGAVLKRTVVVFAPGPSDSRATRHDYGWKVAATGEPLGAAEWVSAREARGWRRV